MPNIQLSALVMGADKALLRWTGDLTDVHTITLSRDGWDGDYDGDPGMEFDVDPSVGSYVFEGLSIENRTYTLTAVGRTSSGDLSPVSVQVTPAPTAVVETAPSSCLRLSWTSDRADIARWKLRLWGNGSGSIQPRLEEVPGEARYFVFDGLTSGSGIVHTFDVTPIASDGYDTELETIRVYGTP